MGKTWENVFFRAQSCNVFSIVLYYSLWVGCGSSQLFNYNEASKEWIGPSSINKQEWDTSVTIMFYQFLAPEGEHPT